MDAGPLPRKRSNNFPKNPSMFHRSPTDFSNFSLDRDVLDFPDSCDKWSMEGAILYHRRSAPRHAPRVVRVVAGERSVTIEDWSED